MVILKISQISQENTHVFKKFAAFQTWSFITTLTQVFSCDIFEISEITFLDRKLPVATSEITKNWFCLRRFE